MRVLVQYRYSPPIHAAAVGPMSLLAAAPGHAAPQIRGLRVDAAFQPVQVPERASLAGGAPVPSLAHLAAFSFQPEASTYLVRATLPTDAQAQERTLAEAQAHPEVVAVFSDPDIAPIGVYCGQAAVGTDADVASRLDVAALAAGGMDGHGVDLAIVDTGINLAYLHARGRTARLSHSLSWTPPGVPTKPGAHPVDHGTMCAFDATIAAPRVRLIDVAVLLSVGGISGMLSDAVAAYGRLLQTRRGHAHPRPLVVSNSWGLFDPSTDFPPGHPGNYSDNPNHPFNIIVSSLEAAGADIVFAAGNCGRDCPDGRCAFASTPICGANSHPRVLSIGGVDVRQRRLGYSSQGPGRLSPQKPDVMAYTHFLGSQVFGSGAADSGTSAACPVAAGILAAVRSRRGPRRLAPDQLRNLVTKTAQDLGGVGWDPDYGWGLLQPDALVAAMP